MDDDARALLLRLDPERIYFGPPPWAWEHDDDSERCAAVFDHDHGKSQCFLRRGHRAEECAGTCSACYWDDNRFDDCGLSWVDPGLGWLRFMATSPSNARFILASRTNDAVLELARHLARLAPGCVVFRHSGDCTVLGRSGVLVSEDRPEKARGLAEVHSIYIDGTLSDWFAEQIQTRLAPGGRLFRVGR